MITIVGGGVFGLATGWTLAKAGYDVTILEKDKVGRGATWVAAGMLMPWKLSSLFSLDLFHLQQQSHALWPDFAQELTDSSTIDLHYQTNGRYFLALDQKAVNRFKRQFDFHQQAGLPVEWLSGDEARQRVPALSPQVQASIFTSLAHNVDNRQLVVALCQAFRQAGGTLQEQTPVQEIIITHNQVTGVQLTNEILQTDTLILAAGAGLSQLAGLPPQISQLIEPLKGQTLTLQMDTGQPLIQQQLIGPVYLVPRQGGQLVVGTTVEDDAGFDTRSTVAGVYHMLRKAQNILPGLADCSIIEMSAGSRPTGPGRVPVLGPTAIQGLIMATGGHSYGILLSPAVAQAIHQLVETGRVPEAIQPFVPTGP